MVDDGQAIPVSEMIDKIKNSGSLEDLQLSLQSYLLSDIKEKFGRYKSLVKELSEQQGKTVDVDISGDEVLVEYSKYSDFVNVSIHLFRNMVDHGIETEEERREKEKSLRGKITINFKKNGKSFFIHFIDDGGGIDPSRIRAKVLEKGLKSPHELEALNDLEILSMIFLPGFSTKEEVTDISGRGVGMDAVKAEIEKLGGSITVSSILDEGTTFVIELPLLN
jgi:two-component system chemotaxis sensor kinase CheA